MSVKSAEQWGLMQAARAGKLRGEGPSPEVAAEFISKTPKGKRKKFARAQAKKRKRKGKWEKFVED